jgi:uncharacterized repeat protein (TIGR01451 family)
MALVLVLSLPSAARAQAVGPDLVIAMSHTGNFTVGENGVYTIVVSNIGGTATNGGILLTDEMLPPGFTYVSATGTSWSCYLDLHQPPNDNSTATCTSSSVIAAGGSGFPITLTVRPYRSGTVTNTALVFGGGENPPFLKSVSDVTIVMAAVPTLPEWAMIALTVLLSLAGFAALHRRTIWARARI